MPFKMNILTVIMIILLSLITSQVPSAEVIERVVAIVNDDVILLSDLQEAMMKTGNKDRMQVLNNLIDRRLLLEEALRYFPLLKGEDEETIIRRYIDLRIRPFIRVPLERIESYYETHKELYRDKRFYDVKDEIERALAEAEVKDRLKGHIKELRRKAYIRIQLED